MGAEPSSGPQRIVPVEATSVTHETVNDVSRTLAMRMERIAGVTTGVGDAVAVAVGVAVGTGVGIGMADTSTATGESLWAVVPLPSWPSALYPQQYDFRSTVSPQEKPSRIPPSANVLNCK
jgi:hypothetical protein